MEEGLASVKRLATTNPALIIAAGAVIRKMADDDRRDPEAGL